MVNYELLDFMYTEKLVMVCIVCGEKFEVKVDGVPLAVAELNLIEKLITHVKYTHPKEEEYLKWLESRRRAVEERIFDELCTP